jgi:hypothetical protein
LYARYALAGAFRERADERCSRGRQPDPKGFPNNPEDLGKSFRSSEPCQPTADALGVGVLDGLVDTERLLPQVAGAGGVALVLGQEAHVGQGVSLELSMTDLAGDLQSCRAGFLPASCVCMNLGGLRSSLPLHCCCSRGIARSRLVRQMWLGRYLRRQARPTTLGREKARP